MKKLAWKLLHALGLSGYMIIAYNSALTRRGWFRSYAKRRAIDKAGQPIPWLNYAAMHVLAPRLQPHMRLFEYGAGSSTLWFGPRVQLVASVEHDPTWHAMISRQLPQPQLVALQPDAAAYPNAILAHTQPFDIILIDGIVRNDCAQACLARLSPQGVIVFDNTDVADWQPGVAFLRAQGFRQLEFVALAPGVAQETATSIFYRADNCLNL